MPSHRTIDALFFDVGINRSPASYAKKESAVYAAESALAENIRKIRNLRGSIDIDRFDSEVGAFAPLIVEGFSGRGDPGWRVYVNYPPMDPEAEPDSDDDIEEADFIRELAPQIVAAVKKLTREMKEDSYYYGKHFDVLPSVDVRMED